MFIYLNWICKGNFLLTLLYRILLLTSYIWISPWWKFWPSVRNKVYKANCTNITYFIHREIHEFRYMHGNKTKRTLILCAKLASFMEVQKLKIIKNGSHRNKIPKMGDTSNIKDNIDEKKIHYQTHLQIMSNGRTAVT